MLQIIPTKYANKRKYTRVLVTQAEPYKKARRNANISKYE